MSYANLSDHDDRPAARLRRQSRIEDVRARTYTYDTQLMSALCRLMRVPLSRKQRTVIRDPAPLGNARALTESWTSVTTTCTKRRILQALVRRPRRPRLDADEICISEVFCITIMGKLRRLGVVPTCIPCIFYRIPPSLLLKIELVPIQCQLNTVYYLIFVTTRSCDWRVSPHRDTLAWLDLTPIFVLGWRIADI